ncbi:MAG: hypothetical protein FJ125_07310, partial [Deltaproteobacteria bacterium]|nr:hypothetical protein [Deltaproteobacteria bacterium]
QERCSLRLPEQAVRFLAAGEGRRQRLVRRRRAFTVLGGALLAAVALGSLAVAWALAAKEREAQAGRQQAEQQRTIAEERRREAEQRTSEALREGTRAALARRDYVEARARLRSSLELQDSLLGRALWWTLRQEPVVARRMLNGNAYDAAYSADGRTLAVACQDRSVYLLDAATLDVRQVLGCSDQVRSAALSPDGRWLGAGLVSGNVWLWDLARPGQPRVLEARHGHYGRMAFTPDSNQLAFSNTDGTVRLWDLARPEQVSLLQAPGMPELTGLALDATGRRLAAAGFDGAVWLWEAPWGEAPPQRLDGHRDRVLAVAFDRRGELLASGSFD